MEETEKYSPPPSETVSSPRREGMNEEASAEDEVIKSSLACFQRGTPDSKDNRIIWFAAASIHGRI
jgi:hypothetical protein